MSEEFEQISIKPGFMKHNGGLLFKTISENEYEFKTIIKENHLLFFFSFFNFLFSLKLSFGFFITLESLNDLPLYLFDIKSLFWRAC